jgi:hypothetical protein
MKPPYLIAMAALAAFAGGCANPNQPGRTSATQPGPVAGKAVGGAVGAVGGNVAAGVVGVGEGTAAGVAKAFDSKVTVVRRWRTEVTPDGRTVQVPEDIIVNGNER